MVRLPPEVAEIFWCCFTVPLVVRKSSHTAPRLRAPYSQSYLKHHQDNVIRQHQFAAAQNAMQHHVDRVRQQSYVGNPYNRYKYG